MNRDATGDPKLTLNLLVQVGELEGEAQEHGGGSEEDVRGDIEFNSNVKGISAKEVDDKRSNTMAAGGGEGAKGAA